MILARAMPRDQFANETGIEYVSVERARVQHEIVQYSTLTRAALQSTKIIAESLTQLKKAPDATTLPDLKDQSVAQAMG